MELLIIVIVVYFGYLALTENDNTNNSQLHTKRVGYNSKKQETDQYISYFTLNEVPWETFKLYGNSIIFVDMSDMAPDDTLFYFYDGIHIIMDDNFNIKFDIHTHRGKDNLTKKYFTNIVINDIPVHNRVTNKSSAVEAVSELSKISNGYIFDDERTTVGLLFVEFCANLLYFNNNNNNRILEDYTSLNYYTLKNMLTNSEKENSVLMDEIFELSHTSSNYYRANDKSKNVGQFDIYLKVLEFDSVYNVSFEEIKQQYRILSKRYHPDSPTGDTNRFKLITEAYNYLQDNYPRVRIT